jgi:uncharacterized repeat protein (TIGR03803 family)
MVRFFPLCLVAAGTLFGAILAPHAAGYRYQKLYTFCMFTGCPDGGQPFGGLVMDGAGNLYGTASQGGVNNSAGAVFELRHNATRTRWTETVIYSFCSQANCTDGRTPLSGLIMDQVGDLYGTATTGGMHNAGVVFELTPNNRTAWTETVLYSFCSRANCVDGAQPKYGRLLMDRAGNLYGTTMFGGGPKQGVVFKLTPKPTGGWTETVVYAFCPLGIPCPDGAPPNMALILDSSGNLYGASEFYGSGGQGVVFKVTPHGSETVLYNFCSRTNCADGASPAAGPIMDRSGNLYGTTLFGGAHRNGVVYELSPGVGVRWKERVLHSFCAGIACADGAQPWAGVIMDGAGNLYGSTVGGTVHNSGVVFQLARSAASPTGFIEKVLHVFCSQTNCADGGPPYGGVIRDQSGNLYGTTQVGGLNSPDGQGVVFELVSPP